MPRAGFELTIPVFEQSKSVRALDRAAIGTGKFHIIIIIIIIIIPSAAVISHLYKFQLRLNIFDSW
jgi:hypothetical protein